MGVDQLVEASDALHPFWQAAVGQALALDIGYVDIMVGFGPVHPYKDHPCHPPSSDHFHR
jgi:hypothetical protein